MGSLNPRSESNPPRFAEANTTQSWAHRIQRDHVCYHLRSGPRVRKNVVIQCIGKRSGNAVSRSGSQRAPECTTFARGSSPSAAPRSPPRRSPRSYPAYSGCRGRATAAPRSTQTRTTTTSSSSWRASAVTCAARGQGLKISQVFFTYFSKII